MFNIDIAIQKSQVIRLVRNFPPPDLYLDENSIFNAINKQSVFNMIDVNAGDKVDFWILTNEPFDQSRFSHKICEEFTDLKMQVSSPEDTILAKLRWTKLSGGSEKQFTHALRVYEVQYRILDMDYLEHRAKKLHVESLWKQLKDEAETE